MMLSPEEIASAVTACEGGVRLRCRVQPRASRNGIAGMADSAVRIAVQAPPVEGKANQFLCRIAAEWAGLSRSSCQVIGGETSRNKVLFLAGITAGELCDRLSAVSR